MLFSGLHSCFSPTAGGSRTPKWTSSFSFSAPVGYSFHAHLTSQGNAIIVIFFSFLHFGYSQQGCAPGIIYAPSELRLFAWIREIDFSHHIYMMLHSSDKLSSSHSFSLLLNLVLYVRLLLHLPHLYPTCSNLPLWGFAYS